MLTATNMFYPDRQEPSVSIYGDAPASEVQSPYRRGHLSRQDSRNFRSSRSPPPSRYRHHASSWFGHRKSSLSPPRSRHRYGSSGHGHDSSQHRSIRSWFGFGDRRTHRHGSSYHDDTDYDYRYPRSYDGHRTGYRHQYGDGYSGNGYSSGYPHMSSQVYHGQSTATTPRTYQSAYGQANNLYSESVMLDVPICCEACEERITDHLLALPGVSTVTCDQMQQMVTVRGSADPADILRQAKDCFRNARFWRS